MPPRSRLVQVGKVLFVTGLFGGPALRSLGNWMKNDTVLEVSDLVAGGFCIGAALWAAGALKDRMARRAG